MIARSPTLCTVDSWQACLIAMNDKKDVVIMSAPALTDVIRCHQNHGGSVSHDLVIREGHKMVQVRRSQLWDLVQAHGIRCGKGAP